MAVREPRYADLSASPFQLSIICVTLHPMTAALQRQSDGTIELTITIPWSDVAKMYAHVVDEMVVSAELPGFRKGKAPKNLVEEKLDKTKVYEDVLKHLIPEVYGKTVAEHKLRPIVTPKIELKEATENKDWIIRALTCEKPAVTLGEYKKAIQDVKASKAKKIWVPGKDEPKDKSGEAGSRSAGEDRKPTLDELLKALFDVVKVSLPAMLVEHEVNRLLSDLIDQTKKLGLTVEQYLASTQRTVESVRHEYDEQSRRTLTLEFSLEEVADKEGILVSDDDIDAVVKTAKTDEEKATLEKQRYYLAQVLRRQKTLDFLASL